jgi:hypothetical protein
VRLYWYRRARRYDDPYGPAFTAEEVAALEEKAAGLAQRLDAGPPLPADCPVPLLPVAQLYLRDVPLLRPPGDADLLQVLWCPYDHEPNWKPATAVFWRSAASVGDVLAAPPEPYEANYPGYVPEPCVLAPEAVTEYPNSLELDPESRRVVGDPSRWEAAGDVVDGEYAEYPPDFYNPHLAVAPGWKVGGWAPWGRTDPNPRYCAVCEARMVPLLTIASFEWDGATYGWAPEEDHDAAHAGSHIAGLSPAQPTQVEVGSADNMQLYVCPASPEHPHTDLIQ